mmetsp:Transcript_5546/g.12126  ORF Transcript_5546/g.12126 Transcript_5546/m.12126 type:complete len:81 (-) Transcript_5546:146-388(-)
MCKPNHNDGVKVKMQDVQVNIDGIDARGSINGAEGGECVAAQLESSEDLKGEKSRKEGVDKELGWRGVREPALNLGDGAQ